MKSSRGHDVGLACADVEGTVADAAAVEAVSESRIVVDAVVDLSRERRESQHKSNKRCFRLVWLPFAETSGG